MSTVLEKVLYDGPMEIEQAMELSQFFSSQEPWKDGWIITQLDIYTSWEVCTGRDKLTRMADRVFVLGSKSIGEDD